MYKLKDIWNKDYLQILAYMLRFESRKGYFLYPEKEEINDKILWLNKGSTFEQNVIARDDIFITKHGLKIPESADSYDDFSLKMKASEQELIKVFMD